MRAQQLVQPPLDAILPLVANYVRNITNMYDLDAIGQDVFHSYKGGIDEKMRHFKASVEFYWRGTKDAWSRHRKGMRFDLIWFDLTWFIQGSSQAGACTYSIHCQPLYPGPPSPLIWEFGQGPHAYRFGKIWCGALIYSIWICFNQWVD